MHLIGLLLLAAGLTLISACAAPTPSPVSPGLSSGGGAISGRPAPGAEAAPAARDAGTTTSVADQNASSLLDRLIIRTTSLNLSVPRVADAVEDVQTLVNRFGGYVATTRFRNDEENSTATLSVRVPTERVDSFLRDLRGLAVKVNDESTQSQDVTEEYTDLSAQLRNQEATEAQYLELMKRANTVDEILKVQQQLSQIRGQIERTKGRIQYLERRTDLAQIDITLVPAPAANIRGSWDVGETVLRSWNASLLVLQRVAEATIIVAVFLWWLVPLGVILYAAAALVRGRRRKAATA
jgi:hypothetical protein